MSIGTRLQSLINTVAEDIKECANACDTYSGKRLLVKVFKGPAWDEKLSEYIQRFADHKAQFNFKISIHSGMAVDRMSDQLDTLMARFVLILLDLCKP